MDKKNTMLLTVIAVATLLVAVVGATFAYFSVDSTNTSATTAVTTKAEAVGTVALANGQTAFYLNVSAAQMAEDLKGTKTYYAQTTDVPATDVRPAATVVANFSAEEVADNNVTYNCTFSYTVSTESSDSAALAVLKADGSYELSASTGVTLNKTTFNLGETDSSTGSVTLTDGGSATISAIASLANSETKQDAIAGKTFQTNITFNNFVCDTIANS